MSPRGSNDPQDKCSPSDRQRARLTLLLPNSNTLETGTDTNTGHKVHPVMMERYRAFVYSILNNIILNNVIK